MAGSSRSSPGASWRPRDDAEELKVVLEEARAIQNVEVEVYALDALASLMATAGEVNAARSLLDDADMLVSRVAHLVDETDRVDGNNARQHTTTE